MIRPATIDRWIYPFGLALTLAAAVRLLIPFDGLYGQDAFAYFRFAAAIWPHWRHNVPLPTLYWPHGYPLAVAALLPICRGGPLAGQLVSALGCGAAAGATFLLVAELQRLRDQSIDPTPRLVAGLCVASSGIALRSGQADMSDGLGLGLAAVSLWFAARAIRTRRGAWLLPCAATVACGTVTRWQIALVGVTARLE